MATYDDDEVAPSSIRGRAIATAVGLIAVVGAAALVGNATRDDATTPTTTVAVAAPEETVPAPTTPAPTTAAPQALPCPVTGAPQTRSFPLPPPMCIDMAAKYRAKIRTDKGTIWVTLDQNAAPQTVNNFVYLARYQYFDGLPFHKVIGDFLIQTGSPTPDGEGGPGYAIPAEPGTQAVVPGAVLMADRSNGSQFFIVTGAFGSGLAPADFNPIGIVSQGLDVVENINALAVPESVVSSSLVTVKTLEIVAEGEGGAAPVTPETTTPAA
jgi:cyclophilin family peptidyl-prolyl cis-trans isomerase